MGDRTETVRYKIVVDQEGLPETIQPKQIPGPPPLPGGEATPPPLPGEEESPRQRVRVQRVPHEARMFEMFARLLRTPQFSSGMADSLFGFAQRAGLGGIFSRIGTQAGGTPPPAPTGGVGLQGILGAIPGGLGTAGLAGLAILGAKSMHEGLNQMAAGRSQMIGSSLGANPSGVIKGGLGVYGGMWHMSS